MTPIQESLRVLESCLVDFLGRDRVPAERSMAFVSGNHVYAIKSNGFVWTKFLEFPRFVPSGDRFLVYRVYRV